MLAVLLSACVGDESLFGDVAPPSDPERQRQPALPVPEAMLPMPAVPEPAAPTSEPPLAPPGGGGAGGGGEESPPEPPPALEPDPDPPMQPEEPPPPACTGPFGAPELITGLGVEGPLLGPAFSADARTLFFSSIDGDESIFTATRTARGAEFSPAVLVDNLDDGGSEEGTPFLSADGLSLYFFSTRPGPGTQGERDIWLARRPSVDAPFEPPAVLPAINGPELEHLPHLSADELTIVFVSTRPSPNGASNLWLAQRANREDEFSAAVEVAGINTDAREEGFSLSQDGLTLFFASNRDALDHMDLWVASRSDRSQDFGAPENLAALNSSADELDPQLSPDGSELFFTSSRDGGFQLFRAVRDCASP